MQSGIYDLPEELRKMYVRALLAVPESSGAQAERSAHSRLRAFGVVEDDTEGSGVCSRRMWGACAVQ